MITIYVKILFQFPPKSSGKKKQMGFPDCKNVCFGSFATDWSPWDMAPDLKLVDVNDVKKYQSVICIEIVD